jgi:hypothetical protein
VREQRAHSDWGAYASRVWIVASRDDELLDFGNPWSEVREGGTPSVRAGLALTPETGVLPRTWAIEVNRPYLIMSRPRVL